MTTTILLIIFLLTFSLGFCITPYLVKLSRELHLYDLPDSRKVHKLPIPRIGGMAFLPCVTIVITIVLIIAMRLDNDVMNIFGKIDIQNLLAYVSGGMMLFVVGLYDDIRGVGYKIKFAAQLLAAILLCAGGLWIADFNHVLFIDRVPFWIGMPVTIFFVIYVTNAMNLIDGIDGLASGLATISLAVIMILNLAVGDDIWATIPAAYIGVLIAFYYYNVFDKNRKIFMGDAGSLTLGYTLAFLTLHFWQANSASNSLIPNIGIVAMSTLIIPMFDVVRVFMSRVRDGRNPFLPDKNHIHHKLMRTGMSGTMTMVTILLMSIGLIAINYFMASYVSQTLMVIFDIVLYIVVQYTINFFIKRMEKTEGIEYDRKL